MLRTAALPLAKADHIAFRIDLKIEKADLPKHSEIGLCFHLLLERWGWNFSERNIVRNEAFVIAADDLERMLILRCASNGFDQISRSESFSSQSRCGRGYQYYADN